MQLLKLYGPIIYICISKLDSVITGLPHDQQQAIT